MLGSLCIRVLDQGLKCTCMSCVRIRVQERTKRMSMIELYEWMNETKLQTIAAFILLYSHTLAFTHSLTHFHSFLSKYSCMQLFYGRSHNTYLEWIIFIECDYFQHFAKTLEYLMQNVQRDGIQKRLNYHT